MISLFGAYAPMDCSSQVVDNYEMFQAHSDDDAVKLALAVQEAVKDFPALDISSLNKFITRS